MVGARGCLGAVVGAVAGPLLMAVAFHFLMEGPPGHMNMDALVALPLMVLSLPIGALVGAWVARALFTRRNGKTEQQKPT